MAYVRSKADYKSDETKFVYERELKSTRTTTKKVGVQREVIEETTTELRTRKVTLKTYAHSNKEDCEHFFECFEKMMKELEDEWTTSSKAKANDAKVLFQALESMLVGTANSEWHDVLGKEQSRTWEMFKTLVSRFICSKVLPEDAYNRQVMYMQERVKPMALTAKEWWLRMQTLNRYLPYFFPSLEALKRELPDSTFPDWWIKGGLNEAELKRIIIVKVPSTWQNQLRRNDVGHDYRDTKSTNDLIDYFTTLEALEQNNRQAARRTPRGRTNPARSGRFEREYYSRQYYGRSPGQFGPSQSGYPAGYNNTYGSADPRRNSMRYQSRPGSYSHMQQQGGRGRGPTPGRYSGRFGGQRDGYSRFQPNQGRGGFQGQQFNRYQRPESYFQEEEKEKVDTEPEPEVEDEQFADMSEEQLNAAWNESLFLEDQGEDDFYAFDEDEEESDYDDSAAFTGGNHF